MTSKEEISNISLKDLIEHETGRKFDRNNKMCCPLHNEKTPSFSIKKYGDKDRFYCYGCGAHGDVFDFIKKYKNMNYNEASQYLGIEPNEEYKDKITLLEKVEGFINKIGFKDNNGNSLKHICTYTFVDQYNKPIYFKAKFKDINNKSTSRYLSLKDNNVITVRGCDELPYNYYKLLQGINEHKHIFLCEGEKDSDTLSYMGYIATSFKGVTKFDYSIFKGSIIYIVPDTGKVGEEYKDNLYYQLKDYVKEFNVIYPKGWDKLPSNFDVTDWFKSGKTLDDFKAALRDKWDYKESKFWRDVDVKITSKGEEKITPKKTWRNVEQILKYENINLKYNLISKEAEATGSLSSTGDELIIDIQTICLSYNLNINKDVVCDAILKISRMNQYNPFIDYLEVNKNSNHKLIEQIFNCIVINDEFANKRDTYLKYFTKWLMDLISMSQNTIEKGLKSQGVLVLQGKQGGRKSTFFKKLMSNNFWFNGEANIDPKNKDSIWQNTGYILVELSEFDGMSKKDQESMKRFLTNDIDIYRVPYARCHEKHPRITTFCATVNPKDFLKDKTGSRRFWVIPIEKCDIEAMKQININEFWGAVYNLWCTGKVSSYLDEEEVETLLQDNTAFNMESDISIAIDEKFNFTQNKIAWKVYNLGEIATIIGINETKAIKNELERRRFKCGSHRDNYLVDKNNKWGFKLPNVNIKEAQRIERDFADNPFKVSKEQQTNDILQPKEVIKEITNPWLRGIEERNKNSV
ncbi:hypothetical protein FDB52_05030 [Clostridium botulinum]|nr:hypothetical protein [Clostridium botulinum]NFN47917.1 hypothetical protein [Clostridium botulinum]